MLESIRRLHKDHIDFVILFRELNDAVECDDASILQACWTKFESRLSTHMAAEERYLLPGLESRHPVEAERLRGDHGRFRSLLAELGVRADLHLLRKTASDELLQLLESHAAWEDKTIYKWAEQELDADTHFSILRALSGT
ncbi:MAG TPA: hemerythrin domain-containing protein [Polyangiaceae bacterium]|nr:hemerythrin domain-containing protein [Polyangiaceae bacterium]